MTTLEAARILLADKIAKLAREGTLVVELRLRHYPDNASWKPGGVIRGDREIWVEGERWGYATMVSRGSHGPRYDFSDALDRDIMRKQNNGKISDFHKESVDAYSAKREWRHRTAEKPEGDKRSTDQRIIDKARELIGELRMKAPAVIRLEQVAAVNRRAEARAAEVQREDRMRVALKAAYAKVAKRMNPENYGPKADDIRAGLADAYREIFHGEIE